MSSPISIVGSQKVYTVTIAVSESMSDEIEVQGQINGMAIEMPSEWTAAGITFFGSRSAGGTYKKIMGDTGTELAIIAATSEMIALDATKYGELRPFKYIKLVSGTSGTPVAQEAERVLYLITK